VNRYLDDDPDLPRHPARQRLPNDAPEREISLGTTTILGIFFALALGAAAIFGLGYTLGRKSAQTATVTPDTSTSEPSIFSPKPAAGSQAPAPSSASANTQPATDTPATPASSTPADTTIAGDKSATPQPTTNNQQPASTVTVPLTPPKNAATPADAAIAGDKIPASQPATSNQQPATSYTVQVAAVSSQDVADILISSLQKKGYSVAARRGPDNLLHVQIGPFTRRADAEAMRQRVLADGFNAIVK
jgi:cytoskeletal protein RodZ